MGNKIPDEVKKAEGDTLKALCDAYIKENKHLSQSSLGRRIFNRDTGKSLLHQHIHAIRPIPIDSGITYANFFGKSLRDLSPRLADIFDKSHSQPVPAIKDQLLISEPDMVYHHENVKKLQSSTDPIIQEVLSLLESTDRDGKIKALMAVKFALKDHIVVAKNRAK